MNGPSTQISGPIADLVVRPGGLPKRPPIWASQESKPQINGPIGQFSGPHQGPSRNELPCGPSPWSPH